jgi:hypothetical protein
METWAIVTLVLGTNAVSALVTFFITKMQVRHSDRRFEEELHKEIVMHRRQRQWVIRSEPLLNLRDELAVMATKQDKLTAAAHRQLIRVGITEEEAKRELQEAVDGWNAYVRSGNFAQTLFLQYDAELRKRAEEILRDYQKSYIDAMYYKDLKAEELKKAMGVFERNKTRIIEVQELINKRLEEL